MSTTFEEKLLIKEYLRLCTEIRTLETKTDAFIFGGLALISIFTVLYEQSWMSGEALPFLLVLALLTLWSVVLVSYVSIFSFAGYKRHLEDQLNERAGARHLLWEQLVPERQKRNKAAWLASAITVLFTASLLWINLDNITSDDLLSFAGILVIVFVILFAIVLRNTGTVLKRTYEQAQRLSRKEK